VKRCPFCAEEIQDAAIVCKHCGRDLPAASTPEVSHSATQPAKKASGARWAGLLIFGSLAMLWISTAITGPPVQRPLTNGARAGKVESRRNLTGPQLARIVESADEKCPTARRIFFQGADANSESWNIECSTGESFAVRVENDGHSKVLSCDAMKAVTKLACFKTFDEQR
jgi:hypothetical protein